MVSGLTQDASVRGWWSVGSGVSDHRGLGSRKAAWIWLVNVPGVERPATEVALAAAANLSTAGRPGLLEAATLTRALRGNRGSSCPRRLFSVLSELGCDAAAPPLVHDRSIRKSGWVPPSWGFAARNLRTASSVVEGWLCASLPSCSDGNRTRQCGRAGELILEKEQGRNPENALGRGLDVGP